MSIAGARILLVEDDAELADFVQHMLVQEKYDVVVAGDGEDALQKARSEKPELILLDVLLPKMHGFEVCQHLRQDPATCLIPIIMVTSLTAIKDRLTGFKLGADEYVSKPFEPIELLARIERLITRTRSNIAANPLTGMAGANVLDEEIRKRLLSLDPFTVGYGDANGLGFFNESFGYERGDGVIRLLGTILRSAVTELGNKNDLVAHMGGDDFAFLSTPSRAEVIASRILENIEFLIPMQYDDVSREEGAHVIKGNGEKTKKPFLSFTMGLVNVESGHYKHHAQVLDQAKRTLSEAKKKGGNQLVKV